MPAIHEYYITHMERGGMGQGGQRWYFCLCWGISFSIGVILFMKIEARRMAVGRGKEHASVGQEGNDARKGSPSVPSQRGQEEMNISERILIIWWWWREGNAQQVQAERCWLDNALASWSCYFSYNSGIHEGMTPCCAADLANVWISVQACCSFQTRDFLLHHISTTGALKNMTQTDSGHYSALL